jgi:hypothetical protein
MASSAASGTPELVYDSRARLLSFGAHRTFWRVGSARESVSDPRRGRPPDIARMRASKFRPKTGHKTWAVA